MEIYEKNTVPSKNQVDEEKIVSFEHPDNAELKILFVGNSITCHGPNAAIGWLGNWGMAASCKEKDYVHQLLEMLKKKYNKVSYCIAAGALWENNYENCDEIAETYYRSAKEYSADVIIMRIGENVNRSKNAEISCKPYYEELIKFLSTDNTKQVIVTDNFWEIEALDTAFREVAKANGYTFCQLHDLSECDENMAIGLFEHEGVSIHPSDLGMKRIAERIYAKIAV